MKRTIACKMILLLLSVQPLAAKTMYQEMIFSYRNISFKMQFDDREYTRSDTLKIRYEVRNTTSYSIWVYENTKPNGTECGLSLSTDIGGKNPFLKLNLGGHSNAEYACNKFIEIAKGNSYTTIYSIPCESIVQYYEKHRTGEVGTWYRYEYELTASIGFFEKDYLRKAHMQYIAEFNGQYGKLREEDLFNYNSNLVSITLSGMVVKLYYE